MCLLPGEAKGPEVVYFIFICVFCQEKPRDLKLLNVSLLLYVCLASARRSKETCSYFVFYNVLTLGYQQL